LVSWPKVMRPKELGGLGISDLKILNWALRLRWLWLSKIEPNKPWAYFPMQVNVRLHAFFSMAVTSEVGDGTNTLFWKDKWLSSQSISDLAPLIASMIPKRISNRRRVAEALTDWTWVNDIHGTVMVQIILEFLNLCSLLAVVSLQPRVPNKHSWRLSNSGVYSAKSAYMGLLQGDIAFNPWERIWKTWAPNKCRFFLWLVAHNRCWIADRLERRNLPHPDKCPLCDQEEETIQHLLIRCVFARQFWFALLQWCGLIGITPEQAESSLDEWWSRVGSRVSRTLKEGLITLLILGAWTIWRHRNDCVFNGSSPRVSTALAMAMEEARGWCMAGAKGLSLLFSGGSGLG
jgi:hypothetical protein